jgi:DNA-binding response OmpR family regulator
MRILLAEDDPNISLITQLCLEKIGGHVVTIASDGEKAIQASQSQEFDLFILDGMMPKFSGLQVAEEIRKTNSATPIIFLSARSEPKEVDIFLRLAAGFIPKPFDPQKICQHIESILKQRTAV